MLLGCGGSKNGSKLTALDASQTNVDVGVFPSTYDSSEAGGDAATDSPQDQVAGP